MAAARKCEKLRREFLEPCSPPGKSNRAPLEQIALRNKTSAFVGIGLVGGDIDRLFLQALDQTTADRRLLDQKGGEGAITLLNLHHPAFEGLKPKLATYHLQNVKHLPTTQQNDTSGVVTGFRLAQRDVPAHNDVVPGLMTDIVIAGQPLALDDGAAGRNRALLVLRRKGD